MDITRLLSMESDKEELAIDRLLDRSGAKEAGPLSLVGDILAKREEMAKEIAEEEKEREELAEKEEDSGSDDSSSDDGGDDDGGGDGDDFDDGDDLDDLDDPADEGDEEEEEDKEEDKDKDKDKEEDKEEDKGSDDGDDKEVATESASPFVVKDYNKKVPKVWDIFRPLKELAQERIEFLGRFNLSLESDGVEEEVGVEGTDVAFSKEAIVESLANLGIINKKYIDATTDNHAKLFKSISKMNERLLNFKKVYERGDIKFSPKLFTDTSTLRLVALREDVNLRDSVRSMIKYLKDTNEAVKALPNNEFGKISDVLNNSGFINKGEVHTYVKRLPGFVFVSVDIPDYNNYLKTSPLEYSAYSSTEYKPSDIYEIKGVSISSEGDIEYLTETLLELVKELAISTDLLKVVIDGFKSLMDSLKILRVGVEEDEYEKLNELNIDDKVHDFIVFKLIVEMLTISIKVSIGLLTGMIEVMEHSLELTDFEPDKEEDKEEDEEEDVDDDTDGDSEESDEGDEE